MKRLIQVAVTLVTTTFVGWFTGSFAGARWGATFQDYAGNRPTVSTVATVTDLMSWAGAFAGFNAGVAALWIAFSTQPQQRILFHLLQEALKQNDTNTVLVIEEKIKEAN